MARKVTAAAASSRTTTRNDCILCKRRRRDFRGPSAVQSNQEKQRMDLVKRDRKGIVVTVEERDFMNTNIWDLFKVRDGLGSTAYNGLILCEKCRMRVWHATTATTCNFYYLNNAFSVIEPPPFFVFFRTATAHFPPFIFLFVRRSSRSNRKKNAKKAFSRGSSCPSPINSVRQGRTDRQTARGSNIPILFQPNKFSLSSCCWIECLALKKLQQPLE